MFKKMALSLLGAAALLSTAQIALAQDATVDPVIAKPVLETRDSYIVMTRQDMRKCMYPICGGYFVKTVNKATTRCADGSMQRECHAVQLNSKLLGWSSEQLAVFEGQFAEGKAMVKGYLEPAPAGQFTADQLTLTEAWQAQGPRSAVGIYYGVHDNGIRCIKAPCPSIDVNKLNVMGSAVHADVNLSATGASKKQIEEAMNALGTTGFLATGALVPTRAPGMTSRGMKLLASQFYLPAVPVELSPAPVPAPQ